MKVKIGNLEISDVTVEDLDELVRRYGGASIESVHKADQNKPTRDLVAGKAVPGSSAADKVVLQKLVEAGSNGVPTNVLGEILGRRGRGARNALRNWSKRVGLGSDNNLDTFEDCRSGTQRGLRLKESFRDVAKHISTQR